MAGLPTKSDADGRTVLPSSISSKVFGYFGMVLAGLVIGLWLREPDTVPTAVAAGASLLAVLAWSSMIRPALWIQADHAGGQLVMRGLVSTTKIPLAAIERIAVRQVTAVRVGEKRYASPVVGGSPRQLMRREQRRASKTPTASADLGLHVEDLLRQRRDDALAIRGIRNLSDEQEALAADVTTTYAWPVIALHMAVAVWFLAVVVF